VGPLRFDYSPVINDKFVQHFNHVIKRLGAARTKKPVYEVSCHDQRGSAVHGSAPYFCTDRVNLTGLAVPQMERPVQSADTTA